MDRSILAKRESTAFPLAKIVWQGPCWVFVGFMHETYSKCSLLSLPNHQFFLTCWNTGVYQQHCVPIACISVMMACVVMISSSVRTSQPVGETLSLATKGGCVGQQPSHARGLCSKGKNTLQLVVKSACVAQLQPCM